MKKVALAAAWLLATSASVIAASELDAQAVFERLATLEGTWKGPLQGEGEEAEAEAATVTEAVHDFRVSAGGSVVMEIMAPGTQYEMINMYHLDGDDLLLTHYCSGGNQPRMRLNRQTSTMDNLLFDFDGGTNLDPATDTHIHSARIQWLDKDRIDSIWTGFSGGQEAGGMTFHLARGE